MKNAVTRTTILFPWAVSMLLIAGCREQNRVEQTDQAGGVPKQTASEAESTVQPKIAEPAQFIVDEASVGPLAEESLAKAEWTRKACSLDDVGGLKDAIVAKKGEASIWSGYVIDPIDTPAGDFSIVLKGATAIAIPAKTGAYRPDVAEYFGHPALETAGFRVSTTLQSVPAGAYSVIFVLNRDGRDYFCESGKEITVQ